MKKNQEYKNCKKLINTRDARIRVLDPMVLSCSSSRDEA